MWTDFQNVLPVDSQKKSVSYIPQRFPPHVQYVAALPCEIRQSKNVNRIFTLNATNLFN